jgi:WhiB family redox-sensing transcriptional regulator
MNQPFLIAATRPEWRERALCAQVGDDLWYPESGGGSSARAAKVICRQCEVRAECLREAIDNDEAFGIWGGLTEYERRRFKRGDITDLTLRCRNGHDVSELGTGKTGCRRCEIDRRARELAARRRRAS